MLIVLITVLLFSIANAHAEDVIGSEENDPNETPATADGHSRPTVFPDLSISSEDIIFSDERFEEDNLMTIEATIFNNGIVCADAYIEFYDGEIDRENLIGSGTLVVYPRNNNIISIYWLATPGEHTIHVMIKNSIPRELIKRNNVAENTIVVNEMNDAEGAAGSGGSGSNGNTDDSLDLAPLSLNDPVVSTSVTGGLLLFLFAMANKHYYWLANLGVIPLYSRITNGQVLKQNTRKDIYDYIVSNPGVYFSSIMKDLKLKNGVTSYHLAMLEREGYIKSMHIGLYRRYFVNGVSTGDIPQSKIRREIIQTIVDNPGISQTNIASNLGVSNQVVNYHIGILRKSNFIRLEKDGFRTMCFINAV
jgi:DNA-binding MarR family transcriptional regulator